MTDHAGGTGEPPPTTVPTGIPALEAAARTPRADMPELLVITGMSGAGRTKAAAVLEDMDWYVVDNLPGQLLTQLAGMPVGTVVGGGSPVPPAWSVMPPACQHAVSEVPQEAAARSARRGRWSRSAPPSRARRRSPPATRHGSGQRSRSAAAGRRDGSGRARGRRRAPRRSSPGSAGCGGAGWRTGVPHHAPAA